MRLLLKERTKRVSYLANFPN
uniref:Uncharacterized protein n=1 Tax=Musa acuminata subsp. malaccensis TaxID=214687 RepID=A0A804KVR9_MUSAM